MSVLFGSKPCVDPGPLRSECADHDLPTDWWGKPNVFRVPLGRGPGAGHLLLRKAELDELDLDTHHTLKFLDDRGKSVELQKITLLRAVCITPGWEDDPRAAYLCEVVDRRHFLSQIPLDKAYNVRSADGTDLLTSSTDGGTAWTWDTLIEDLWTALGLSSVPSLPYTPDGAPENLRYFGGFAWEALNEVLDYLAVGLKYDPTDDTWEFVRLGDEDSAGAVAAAAEVRRLDDKRTWDGYWVEPDRGRLPEKIRVLFPRRPQPTDGTSTYYTVDVTLTAADGVEAGTYGTLHDGLSALAESGSPSNAAALATRAQERADNWRRKRVGYERRLTRVYRDFRTKGVPVLLGETVAAVALDDRGGPMRTELYAAPDGRMERWRPWEMPWDLSGSGTRGFWAEITGSGGSPLGYSWKRKVMTGPGTWADATGPAPLTGTENAYRAPSNVTAPDIPTGQVVELRPSPTSDGDYEIHAVGGIQTETFNIWRYSCSSGSLVETEYTVTVKGRDLTVSVA